jgi:hypothetical protein
MKKKIILLFASLTLLTILAFLPAIVLAQATKPGCSSDNDCPAGTRCYYSQYCGPGGTGCTPVEGDLKCHKSCTIDSDCSAPEKCKNLSIFRGDVGERIKICLQETTTTTGTISFPKIPTTLKDVYNLFTSINPFLLLIVGIVLLVLSHLGKYIAIVLIIFALIQIVIFLIH